MTFSVSEAARQRTQGELGGILTRLWARSQFPPLGLPASITRCTRMWARPRTRPSDQENLNLLFWVQSTYWLFDVAVVQCAAQRTSVSSEGFSRCFMASSFFYLFNSTSDPRGAVLGARGLSPLSQRSGDLPAHLDDERSQNIPTFSRLAGSHTGARTHTHRSRRRQTSIKHHLLCKNKMTASRRQ